MTTLAIEPKGSCTEGAGDSYLLKPKNYHASIVAGVTAQAAIENINHVAAWWAGNFEGSAQQLNDVFTVRFGETWVTFTVVDAVPGEKIEWEVTDCFLPWLADKTEWKNTNLIWEISTNRGATQIDFTHVGLIPETECYDTCRPGWDFYINESLLQLLTKGKGRPDRE